MAGLASAWIPPSPGTAAAPQGLADLFLGANSPISQFLDSHRNAVSAIGAGLGSQANFGNALGVAAQAIPQARQADYAQSLYLGQIAQTRKYLSDNGFKDLEAGVASGAYTPQDAMKMASERTNSPGVAVPMDSVLRNKYTGAAMGGAAPQGYRPLTDPAERAKFGIPPTDTTPYQVDPMGKLSYAGGPQSTVNINNTSESANAGEVGKWLGTKLTTIVDSGMQSQNNIGNLNELGNALANSKTGWGADTILTARKALKTLGVDTGDVSNQELANTFTNKMALQLRNPQNGAGMPGSMSDSDRTFLVSTMPGIANTPQGNLKIIEVAKRVEQRNVDVSKMATKYAMAHKGQLDMNFFQELGDWSAQHPLFTDMGAETAGAGGTDPSGAGAAVAPPPAQSTQQMVPVNSQVWGPDGKPYVIGPDGVPKPVM